MTGACRILACGAAVWLIASAGGCANTLIPADEFVARYTTNIAVPNPDSHELPVRIFLGLQDGEFVLRDIIPSPQGGGLLGKTVLWRCPKAELPGEFASSYRPGNLLVDGRGGAQHRYMIQSYTAAAGAVAVAPAPTEAPATQPASTDTTAAKDE